MRPLVIVNPRSGGGLARGARYLGDLRAVIERRLGPTDVTVTERAGHAIDLARQAARDRRPVVVALGGDGTLHEVANGVLDAGGGTAVGVIGQGTGGDFRRTLGIGHRLDAYLEAIAGGREAAIDVGKVRYRTPGGAIDERWFVNVLSAGISGLVDRYVARTTKAFGGAAAYAWASTWALAESRRGRVRCDVGLDGDRRERQVDTFMLAICNGRYFGGGMHVAPAARLDDGRFDVVSIDAPSKLAFPATMRRLYTGRHMSSPHVEHFACDAITMAIDDPGARGAFLLDVDGEPLGGLPVEVSLVPKALAVRVP